MATYYDKKKLIEDSSDVYISDYDKNLDYGYLSDIIDQKRAYKAAQEIGDTAGMKKANDRANSIRLQAGSYTAGADGSQYNRVKRPYEENEPKKSTGYQKEKERVYGQISSYGDFRYDVYNDPVYQAYKDIYLSLGDDAYERTLSENSLRTGGVSNTSAISAATLAKNKYNSMLASVVPELYENAYARYNDGLERLYKKLDAVSGLSESDYSRYRDDVEDYRENRNYYYAKDKEIADNLYDLYTDETNREYNSYRDTVEDKYNQDELNLNAQKYQNDFMINQNKLAFDQQKHQNEMALSQSQLAAQQQRNQAELALKEEVNRTNAQLDKMALALDIAKEVYGEGNITEAIILDIMATLG